MDYPKQSKFMNIFPDYMLNLHEYVKKPCPGKPSFYRKPEKVT